MNCGLFFKDESIVCDIFLDLNQQNSDDAFAVVTECGFLPQNMSTVQICQAYYNHFLAENIKRRRRRHCEIPYALSSHHDKKQKERQLSKGNIECILKQFGMVFL